MPPLSFGGGYNGEFREGCLGFGGVAIEQVSDKIVFTKSDVVVDYFWHIVGVEFFIFRVAISV